MNRSSDSQIHSQLQTTLSRVVALAVTVVFYVASLTADCGVGFGKARLFNDGWQFRLLPATEWREVTLPHDWSVNYAPQEDLFSCTGYLPGGVGEYRRVIGADELPADGLLYIYFEGVYNRSEVRLNGHLLGVRPSGYASFCYELTPWLNRKGDNVLEVKADHSRQADSRWYTGSGIWRDVWLVTAPATLMKQWATTTEYLPDSGVLLVTTAFESPVASTAALGRTLTATLADAEGRTVTTATVEPIGPAGIAETLSLTLPAAGVRRWDIDDPYLYTLTVTLAEGGRTIDATTFRTGFRTLRFTPDEGFFLNGVNRKVKGVCVHHDAGVLGAAVPEEVWRWRLHQLKELGCNAIRCSHNPQTPMLYDLCDELGLLVMDEASDEWEYPKRKWLRGWNKGTPGFEGTYDYFEEWIDRDVADMVCRDRRHPSIFLWSIGNEVDYPNDPYSHPVLDGSTINQPMFGGYKKDAPRAERIGEIAKRLTAVVKRYDRTRPVTGALAGVVMSNETAYPEAVDVVGYNYTEDRYGVDHARYPQRIIYGSENGHGYEQWLAVRDNPHIFGQFLWTGIDYLGESGAWPSRGLGTGLLDFCGMPKWQGMMRKTMWAQQPGDTLAMPAMPRRQRGGARREGMMQRPAPVAPAAMRVTVLNDSLPLIDHHAAGHDRTVLLLVELTDANGILQPMATADVQCSVAGDARLAGLETGNGQDMSHPRADHRTSSGGRLLAYVAMPDTRKAPATVTFTAEGVEPVTLTWR